MALKPINNPFYAAPTNGIWIYTLINTDNQKITINTVTILKHFHFAHVIWTQDFLHWDWSPVYNFNRPQQSSNNLMSSLNLTKGRNCFWGVFSEKLCSDFSIFSTARLVFSSNLVVIRNFWGVYVDFCQYICLICYIWQSKASYTTTSDW